MATYVGRDGSVSFAASLVGELKSWTLTSDVEIMPDTAMGDVWQTVVGGVASWTGSATAHIDYDSNQKNAIDDIINATPSGDSVAMIFLVATGKTFTGNALVSSVAMSATMGDIIEVVLNFTGNGALAPTWA